MQFYLIVVWFHFSQLWGSCSLSYLYPQFIIWLISVICQFTVSTYLKETRIHCEYWAETHANFFVWQSKNWNSYLNELYSNFLSLSIPITCTLMQIRSRFAINPLIFQLINMQKCRGMNKSVFSVQRSFQKSEKIIFVDNYRVYALDG